MPSKKIKHSSRSHISAPSQRSADHVAFVPLLVLTLAVWVIYRFRLHFPVWFDESIGKALFFGLPVWLYVMVSRATSVVETFSASRFKRGVLLGLAVGGMYGFAGSIGSLIRNGSQVQAAALFSTDQFWWEFCLSLLTGFWETLFFYSWIMVVIQEKYRHWSFIQQIVTVAAIFLVFHIPNIILRFSGMDIVLNLLLLFLFALGQAFVFARRQNAYTLIVSQAIWGMVLLVHLR